MDTHALHATLDDGHDPEPTHISHPDPDNHSDPEIDWSEAFINSDARASDIDALEEALRTFTLTPDEHALHSKHYIYDVNNTPSPYKRDTSYYRPSSSSRANGIRLQSNLAKAINRRDDSFPTDMHIWRNACTVQDVKRRCRNVMPSYSVGVWSAGVGICTIGSVRAGFTPIWGTETDQLKAPAWVDLTSAACLGDTFKVDWSKQRAPVYLTSGTNCEGYSNSGPRAQGLPAGRFHKTGWQFIAQVEHILTLQPAAVRLEMSDGANDTNNGEEVDMVCTSLSTMYYVHRCKRLETWKYGDGTNRKRMFIVCFHREKCGPDAAHYEFPPTVCMEGYYPIAADYAVPDEHVPEAYWVHEPEGEVRWLPWRDPVIGQLHKIAFVVSPNQMGPPQRPYAIYSWLSLFNTQVTTNGGGRRPPLSCTYDPSVPITATRMVCPLESVRVQGLPDDFLTWYYSLHLPHLDDERDNDLRSGVNSGIPLRTSVAIDASVHAMLIQCGVPFDVGETSMPSEAAHFARARLEEIDVHINDHLPTWLGPEYRIRRITLDTGATNTFMYTDIETAMSNSRNSYATIGTASKGAAPLRTSKQGALHTLVFNMCQYPDVKPVTPFIFPRVTTVPELSKELLSPDEFYRYGKFNILLRQPDYEGGVSELFREARPGLPEARIPLMYDWVGSGGWHMYYMASRDLDRHDERMLARHMQDAMCRQDKGNVERWHKSLLSDEQARVKHAMLACHACVQEVKVSSHLLPPADSEAEGSRGPYVIPNPEPSPSIHTDTSPPKPNPDPCDADIPVIGMIMDTDIGHPDQTLTGPSHEPRVGQNSKGQKRPLPSGLPQVGGDSRVMGQEISQDQRVSVINPIPNPKAFPSQLMHHPLMSEIRGATARISRKGINRMSYDAKHCRFCHMGPHPKCKICRMAMGAMRKIYKKVDPYKEIRPGFLIVMDIATFDVESLEGNRYVIVLLDVASDTLWALPIHKRDEVYNAIEDWVNDLRNDPIYDDLPYPVVSLISTDNAGEWGYSNEKWQAMAKRIRVRMRYGCPDRKEEVARGERAVGLFEVLLKACLMERNLPPSWWQRASLDVVFCWNRFAKVNYHAAMPVDGDRPRPIEIMTRGFLSRELLDKQLAEYVPVGTPGLIHDPSVKGSSLGPKTRWAVAVGMYGDQPIWWDPIIISKFRSKSYVAYVLQPGWNYTHFLTLPPLPSTQRRCTLDLDVPEEIVVRLPEVIEIGQERQVPMIDVDSSDDPSFTLNLPEPPSHNQTSDGSERSKMGPVLVDSKGNRYQADKSVGTIDLLPMPSTPLPTPTIITGEAESRPLSQRIQGETLEQQFRDLCEIAPEYQDLAYQQMFDAGKLVGAEEKMELELPEVIYIMM